MGVTFAATGLLAIQNLAVLSLLDRRELGLLGIASGVGSLALVAQYFGVGAATVREVAIAKTPQRAFEIMMAGIVLRLALAAPIAGALLASSGWIASFYGHPELRLPLRLFSLLIMLYGLTEVLVYTLQGLHLWNSFFMVKLLGAIVQLPVVIAGTVVAGVNGYFVGLVGAAVGGALIASITVGSAVTRHATAVHRQQLLLDVREMLGLGLYAHAAKILQVLILQSPILVAGFYYAAAIVGDLKFAFTLGGILLVLSGAVNTINIAVFSRRFSSTQSRDFRQAVAQQIAAVMLITGFVVAISGLLAPELVRVIGGGRYDQAADATIIAMAACALLGLIALVVSTVHIPAGAYQTFVGVYIPPAIVTLAVALLVSLREGGLSLLAFSLLAGSVVGTVAALTDLARRGITPRRESRALVGLTSLAFLPLLGIADVARYVIVLLVVGILLIARSAVSRRDAA